MMRVIISLFIAFVIVVALFTLPVNRFVPDNLDGIRLSVVEPVSLYKGQVYIQIKGEPDVWSAQYKLCSLLAWCVELRNGENQASTIIRPRGHGITLNDLNFVGNNQVLRDIVPTNMASFDVSVNARRIVIQNLACPTQDIQVVEGSAMASGITVLGSQIDNVNAIVSEAGTGSLTILVNGGVEGELNVGANQYSGRFKSSHMPQSLNAILDPQQISSGWSVSGRLMCGA